MHVPKKKVGKFATNYRNQQRSVASLQKLYNKDPYFLSPVYDTVNNMAWKDNYRALKDYQATDIEASNA